MEIMKTLIGIDFVNNGKTATILPSDGGWEACTPDERALFGEHTNAVSWAMYSIGGQVLSAHHDYNWKVALCLVEVETRDLGNFTAKFSDGTYVRFHCKDGRSALSVAKAIGQVIVNKRLQRDEVDLFRYGFAYIYDLHIQGTVMLDLEWWDGQDARAVGNC